MIQHESSEEDEGKQKVTVEEYTEIIKSLSKTIQNYEDTGLDLQVLKMLFSQ